MGSLDSPRLQTDYLGGDRVEPAERLRVMMEMGLAGIIVLDQGARIVLANPRACEITGYDHADLMGMNIGRIAIPPGTDLITQIIDQADQEPKCEFRLNVDLGLYTAQGAEKQVEARVALTRHNDRVAVYILMRDLTERIRTQQSFLRANTFLRKIIDSSVDGIIAADMSGNIIIFNQGAQRIIGYSAEEVIGEIHITRIYPEGLAKEIMRRLRSDDFGGKGKMNTNRQSVVDRTGRQFPVNISAALVYNEKGEEMASVGIFTDLREQLRLKQEIEDIYVQLFQSEKMASLGKLAAGVAHEINNPLGGVLMYAGLMLEQIDRDHPFYDDLKLIVEQTMRCKDIVKELWEFSRPSAGHIGQIDVHQNIEQAIKILQNQAKFHDVEIVKNYDPGLPAIVGDNSQLNQVFINLLVNAADSIDQKGTITITTAFVVVDDRITVKFADTGSGIAPDHLNKIFDPFFTTKPAGEGTGLGLSTSYGIVRRHGGSVDVESTRGQGTTFTIGLPLSPPDGLWASSMPDGLDGQRELIG